LEENGWVRREVCPTDRRGQVAVLTDAGFAALEAAAPGHVEGVRTHLFDALTPQQVQHLGEICAVVADRLRESCTYADATPPCAEGDLTDPGRSNQPINGV
jgi:DNA-binding MarR family transcriptional regulator